MATSPLARGYAGQKPPLGAPLDRSHPLAQGLVGCWLFREGAGGVTTDAADPTSSVVIGATCAWGAGPSGPALKKSATSAGGVTLTTRTAYTTSAGSVVWRFLPAAASNSGTEEMMWGQIQSGPTIEFDAQKFTDNNLYVGWFNNGTERRVIIPATAANWAQNQWQTYALTWGPSGSVLYRNGLSIGSNATAPVTAAISGKMVLLSRTDNQALTAGSSLAFWYAYSRGLSSAEVGALYVAPYQMFLTGASRSYSFASGLFLPPPLVIRGGFLGQSFGGL